MSFRADRHANILIIGGGAIGTSLAYHLARAGAKDVLIVEKAQLTHGSTWHAAGNVTTFHGLYNLTRIQKYSMETYRALDEETGGAVGMKRIGASNQRFRRRRALQRRTLVDLHADRDEARFPQLGGDAPHDQVRPRVLGGELEHCQRRVG